jgi:hypothetical protein
VRVEMITKEAVAMRKRRRRRRKRKKNPRTSSPSSKKVRPTIVLRGYGSYECKAYWFERAP